MLVSRGFSRLNSAFGQSVGGLKQPWRQTVDSGRWSTAGTCGPVEGTYCPAQPSRDHRSLSPEAVQMLNPQHRLRRLRSILVILLACLAGSTVQAALVEFPFSVIDLSSFGGGYPGRASDRRDEAPGAGFTEYTLSGSQDDYGRPDLPRSWWNSASFSDTITTTLSDTEISMRQTGSYFIRGPGEQVNNGIGFNHRLIVWFEVKDQPVMIELFHFRDTAGSWRPSRVSLRDDTELASASDGTYFNRRTGVTSGSPVQMMLSPDVYQLTIDASDSWAEVGLEAKLDPRLYAGLRFIAAVPEPAALSLVMVGLLLLLGRRLCLPMRASSLSGQ